MTSTNNAEIIKNITNSLANIAEQLKKLSFNDPSVTVTFKDNEVVTYTDTTVCNMFKETTISLPTMTSGHFRGIINDNINCEEVYTILFELEPVCTKDGYDKLYKAARKFVSKTFSNTIKLLNGTFDPKKDLVSFVNVDNIIIMTKNTLELCDGPMVQSMIKSKAPIDVIATMFNTFLRPKLDQKFLDLIKE